MERADHLYPPIEPYDLEPPQLGDAAAAAAGEARVSDQPVRWDDEPKEVIELPPSSNHHVPTSLSFRLE
jgi:hypothetical protein